MISTLSFLLSNSPARKVIYSAKCLASRATLEYTTTPIVKELHASQIDQGLVTLCSCTMSARLAIYKNTDLDVHHDLGRFFA